MKVSRLIMLVEELSAQEFLRVMLPKMVPGLEFDIHAYEGKADLLAKLPARLRAFGRYLSAEDRILVLLDRDNADCMVLKAHMEAIARKADLPVLHVGPPARRKSGKPAVQVVNRIAVEELEAWYFGDWEAVCQAYPGVASNIGKQAKYRDPDAIRGGTSEAFTRILQRCGYRMNRLPKVATARAVARHMDPARNTSRSFQCLRDTLRSFVAD